MIKVKYDKLVLPSKHRNITDFIKDLHCLLSKHYVISPTNKNENLLLHTNYIDELGNKRIFVKEINGFLLKKLIEKKADTFTIFFRNGLIKVKEKKINTYLSKCLSKNKELITKFKPLF